MIVRVPAPALSHLRGTLRLAGPAQPVLGSKGRRAARAAARGRRAGPRQCPAALVLDRAGRACRARPGLAEGAAGVPDRDPGHAAALAPPHGRGEMAPAPATGTPAHPG